ncbi:hypothetical protein [Streptomyces sp. SM13]|uniref:hypothetical protein n=1 Tax=Streptomyces sp. SM13 TaxID=1983803 RepID=UPI000CD4D018|nr:hypothetical protein [Streptomyces sp. SM13]
MTKILGRALGAAAVAGIATLAVAAPAFADPTPPGSGLIGSQLPAVGSAGQNNGDTDKPSSQNHNFAQQHLTDAQSIEPVRDLDYWAKPLNLT